MDVFGKVLFKNFISPLVFSSVLDLLETISRTLKSVFTVTVPNIFIAQIVTNIKLRVVISTRFLMLGTVMKCCLLCFTYYFKHGESFAGLRGVNSRVLSQLV